MKLSLYHPECLLSGKLGLFTALLPLWLFCCWVVEVEEKEVEDKEEETKKM